MVMENLRNNLPTLFDDTNLNLIDLDLIDADNLYRSNSEVSHSEYLSEYSNSNDLNQYGDFYDQVNTQVNILGYYFEFI